MPSKCELTGKSALTGNRVSHANNKVKCRLEPNLQKKKYWLNELKKSLTLNLSTSAIKTISKRGGLSNAILMEKPENLSARLAKIQKELVKPRKAKTKTASSKVEN